MNLFQSRNVLAAVIVSALSFGSLVALPREGCNQCRAPKDAKLNKEELKSFNKEASRCHKNRRHRECDRVRVISRVPYTITRSGKYCVQRDLTYTGTESAIIVDADNVTINFANHSLFLTDPAAQGILAVDVEELTILNDKISTPSVSALATSNAINLINVVKARIDNIFTENTNVGVRIEASRDVLVTNSHHINHVGSTASAGIRAATSADVKVDNSVFEGNSGDAQFGAPGVWIEQGSINSVVSNSRFSNIDIGLFIPVASGVLLQNIEVTNYSGAAFNAIQIGSNDGDVSDVILQNVTVTNTTAIPGFDGISLTGLNGFLFDTVIINTNTSLLDDDPSYLPAALHIGCNTSNGGCEPFVTCNNGILRNIIIQNNNDVGFYIEAGENIVFEEGIITGSNFENVLFDTALFSTIKNSYIGDSTGTGILFRPDSNDNSILNNTITGNVDGIDVEDGCIRTHLQGNNVYGNSGNGIRVPVVANGPAETYFNTSCNNGGVNCINVTPSQAPGDSPAVAGSNICCPQLD